MTYLAYFTFRLKPSTESFLTEHSQIINTICFDMYTLASLYLCYVGGQLMQHLWTSRLF